MKGIHTASIVGAAVLALGFATVSTPAQAQGYGSSQAVSWLCTAGSRRWLQFSPCPATYMAQGSIDVQGTTDYGQHITGSGSVGIPQPVQQQALDQADTCNAVSDPSIRIPHHGSSDIYERSVLKGRFC